MLGTAIVTGFQIYPRFLSTPDLNWFYLLYICKTGSHWLKLEYVLDSFVVYPYSLKNSQERIYKQWFSTLGPQMFLEYNFQKAWPAHLLGVSVQVHLRTQRTINSRECLDNISHLQICTWPVQNLVQIHIVDIWKYQKLCVGMGWTFITYTIFSPTSQFFLCGFVFTPVASYITCRFLCDSKKKEQVSGSIHQ